MVHHTLRRFINLTFAFLLAVFSVNLSGVLALENAHAATVPTFNDTCGTENDTYIIPAASNANEYYTVNGSTPQIDEGLTAPGSGTVLIEKYKKDGNNGYALQTPSWSHTFTNDACTDPGDTSTPAGNNGTIKIAEADADDSDNSNANDPQISGCSLNVKFYGYDTGARTATVTFEAQSPTENQLVSPLGAQNVNFTGSGTGNTLDYTAPYTLSFSGAPQAQGYHVKITVHADGSQGNDTKYKTIWVTGCNPTAATPNVTAQALQECILVGSTGSAKATIMNVDDNTNASVDYTVTIDGQQGVITLADGASGDLTFSGISAGSYTISVSGSDGTTASMTIELTECEPTEVPVETVTSHEEVCGTNGDTYTIPSVDGITYQVSTDGGITYVTVSDATYAGLGTIKVRAVANPGYVLTGQNAWTFEFSSNNCSVQASVTYADFCGVNGDTFTTPTTDHVTYKQVTWIYFLWFPIFPISYSTLNAGVHPGSGTINIQAVADEGYTVDGQSSWWITFTNTSCADITATSLCGAGEYSGKVVITLTNDGGSAGDVWVNGTEYTVPANDSLDVPVNLTNYLGHVTVTDENQTTLLNEDFDCTPGRGGFEGTSNITATAVCNEEGILVTLNNEGDGDGEVWIDGFEEPVTVPASESINEIVPLDEDFTAHVLVINSNEQTLFEGDFSCSTTPTDPSSVDVCGTDADTYTVVPTTGVVYKVNGNVLVGAGPFKTNGAQSVTVTAEALPGYRLLGANQQWTYDFTNVACPPGKGNISLAGIMLPQTGPNPLQQLLTIIAAGIAAYGATFYLVNRRDMSKK